MQSEHFGQNKAAMLARGLVELGSEIGMPANVLIHPAVIGQANFELVKAALEKTLKRKRQN